MPTSPPPERCYGGSSDLDFIGIVAVIMIVILLALGVLFKSKMDEQNRHWDKVLEGIEAQQAYAAKHRCTATQETLMPMTNCTAWEPL